YQLTLPDGTMVWLHAATSVTYPASFDGLAERRITLHGEAYFEVAKARTQPFIVVTERQAMEVLGTHFNISRYADDPVERTTLAEGAVKVTAGGTSRQLVPGQAATVGDGIHVATADVEAALAWKNGMFVFNDEPLESILQKVGRWYDVDIEYRGVDKNERYGGSFSRYDTV